MLGLSAASDASCVLSWNCISWTNPCTVASMARTEQQKQLRKALYRQRELEAQRKKYAEDPEWAARRRLAVHTRVALRRAGQVQGLGLVTAPRPCLELVPGYPPGLKAQLFRHQGGRCAICTRPVTLSNKGNASPDQACADHCHVKGTARGVLCRFCNMSLGHYEKHQRAHGLVIPAYERYLKQPPLHTLLKSFG